MSDTRKTPRNALILMDEEDEEKFKKWIEEHELDINTVTNEATLPVEPTKGFKGKPPRRNKQVRDTYEDFES